MERSGVTGVFPRNEPCRMSLHASITVFLRGISVKNEYPIISPRSAPGTLSITTFQFKILKDHSPPYLRLRNGCEFMERSKLN